MKPATASTRKPQPQMSDAATTPHIRWPSVNLKGIDRLASIDDKGTEINLKGTDINQKGIDIDQKGMYNTQYCTTHPLAAAKFQQTTYNMDLSPS